MNMRILVSTLTAMTFTACGGAEEGVELPLDAPETAHVLVVDFVEICSLYMSDRRAAGEMARARGWSDQHTGTAASAKVTGISLFEHEHTDAQIHFMPAAFPHLDTHSCMVVLMRTDLEPAPLKIDSIHQVEGLHGGFSPIPGGDGFGIGRWSFVADNEQTVTINALHGPPRLLQLTMSTHRHLNPK